MMYLQHSCNELHEANLQQTILNDWTLARAWLMRALRMEGLAMCRLLLRFSWRHKICAVATIGTLWMTSCESPTRPSGKVWSFDSGDNGRLLSVGSGDEIDVTLQTIGPGQYDDHPSVSSPAVVFSKVTILTPSNPGGPRQLFQFFAVTAGHAVISIPHTVQNSRFEITVDVR